jgi:hypothetical protein
MSENNSAAMPFAYSEYVRLKGLLSQPTIQQYITQGIGRILFASEETVDELAKAIIAMAAYDVEDSKKELSADELTTLLIYSIKSIVAEDSEVFSNIVENGEVMSSELSIEEINEMKAKVEDLSSLGEDLVGANLTDENGNPEAPPSEEPREPEEGEEDAPAEED